MGAGVSHGGAAADEVAEGMHYRPSAQATAQATAQAIDAVSEHPRTADDAYFESLFGNDLSQKPHISRPKDNEKERAPPMSMLGVARSQTSE